MKQFTNFSLGFFGPEAIATKPLGKHKYMDWKRVQQIVSANPDSVIYAGLQEDWNNTSGLIFAKGKFYDGGSFYGSSNWATPIVDVDGCEIECYTYEKTEEDYRMPKWWGDGQPLLSSYDYEMYGEDEEDGEDKNTSSFVEHINCKCSLLLEKKNR